MGFLDNIRRKAQDYANKNPDKVSQAMGKAEGLINRRTKGKHSAHLSKGRSFIDGRLNRGRRGPGGPTPPPADGPR